MKVDTYTLNDNLCVEYYYDVNPYNAERRHYIIFIDKSLEFDFVIRQQYQVQSILMCYAPYDNMPEEDRSFTICTTLGITSAQLDKLFAWVNHVYDLVMRDSHP